MLQTIHHFFEQQGYRPVAYTGGTAMVKSYEDSVAVVHICNEQTLAMSDVERILKAREEFRKGFHMAFVPVRFLTIVVVKDAVSQFYRELNEQVEGMWFVSERQQCIYVYEGQSTDYYGIYDALTNYVEGNAMEFRRRAERKTVFANIQPVTLALVLINVLVFAVTAVGGDVYDADYMFSVGGITWRSIIISHEYYRLFTCMFLHYGVSHLASNMVSLLCLGTMLEKRIGHVRYACLYILSGLAAGLTSVGVDYIQAQRGAEWVVSVAAGASGAIFGVIGGLIAVVICQKRWRRYRSGFQEIPMQSLLLMTFFSLFQGFTTGGVDNAAHVGGMIFGIVLAFLLAIKP